MTKAKYQLDDFLAFADGDGRDFVLAIHEMLSQEGYKLKVQVTKSYGLHISYSQPKIKVVKGIIVYVLIQDGKLMIRINADHYTKYLNVLNRLPENMLSQMDQADDCMKLIDPLKCWQGCMGYDFHIGERQYQKCLITCFLLCVDTESFPCLLELIRNELRERQDSTKKEIIIR